MSAPRRLVSLRTINARRPIRGTQYKEYFVDGWVVVAHKHEGFTIGEVVVYFEIDSFIPAADGRMWEYSTAFTSFCGKLGYRVRSHNIRGKISQGLMFKLDAVSEARAALSHLEKIHGPAEAVKQAMEMDFADKLGVVKWEPLNFAPGMSLGPQPSFFPSPGCNRVQNCPQLFDPGNLSTTYQLTEKLDGVSMMVYFVTNGSPWYRELPPLPSGSAGETEKGRVGVCRKSNDLIAEGDGPEWKAARKAGVIDRIHRIGNNVVVMGELCGPSIRSNDLGLTEHEFFVFDIFDITRQKMFRVKDTVGICSRLSFPHVPVLGYVEMWRLAKNVEELLRKAEGVGFKGQQREGFVMKSLGNDAVFKAISNSWLLDHGE